MWYSYIWHIYIINKWYMIDNKWSMIYWYIDTLIHWYMICSHCSYLHCRLIIIIEIPLDSQPKNILAVEHWWFTIGTRHPNHPCFAVRRQIPTPALRSVQFVDLLSMTWYTVHAFLFHAFLFSMSIVRYSKPVLRAIHFEMSYECLTNMYYL